MSENYWRRLRQGKLNRRRFLAGTGVAAAGTAAILAGCSDDDDSSSASATAAATSAATSAAATSAAATEAAAAATEAAAAEDRSRYGGTLRLWKDQEDVGLDPAVFHGPNNEVVNYCFTNGLTYQVTKNEFGLDGLAAMEQIDATSTVWTLREGMTFNNGDPVTAEDYAYSIRRVKEIYDERQSHATGNLFNYMDTVEAIDDFTVKETYTLPVPNPPLHRWRQYFGMVNKAVVEAEPLPEGSALHDGQNYPAGMSGGAYLLDKRDATGTSLVVNPNYFRHENPGPSSSFNVDRPYIDQIDTRILADAASRKAAFIAGELDVYGTMDFYDAEELGAYDHINILEAPTAAVAIYGFDNEQFYDNRARRAIRAAMDFDGFRASFWPNGSNLQAPIDIRIAAYQGLTQQDLAKWYVYDPSDAKALWDAYVS
ncbi:MAG: ABC transporter substrate-binding protein, partial [Dehalococcoidia bacterium]|nr:ABC transporter substrate-binding protein [Dehalococcoidia bacterium]